MFYVNMFVQCVVAPQHVNKLSAHINIERGAKSVARFHRIKALALPSLSERATLKAPRR